jgi:hypothetical protein
VVHYARPGHLGLRSLESSERLHVFKSETKYQSLFPMMKRCFSFPLLLVAAAALPSCNSSRRNASGPPSVLPHVNLHASSATPPHRLAPTEYPFAPNGDYVQGWAAAAGGPPAASDRSWSSSHHGGSSGSTRSSSAKKYTSPKKSTASKKKPTSSRRHTVRSGDTLSSLARRYGTTVAKIKSANGLKSDMIRDGRSLIIPR